MAECLVSFGAWKRHIGLYPIPTIDAALERDVAPYRTHADTVRFDYDKQIPYDLIERLVVALGGPDGWLTGRDGPLVSAMSRAVVIMSGGDAVSPFATPDAACGRGFAAGNTDTALREHLLDRGHQVFTAPARTAAASCTTPIRARSDRSATSRRCSTSSTP